MTHRSQYFLINYEQVFFEESLERVQQNGDRFCVRTRSKYLDRRIFLT
jgi:hypothetical protein